MKINKVKLYNFSSYEGDNEFDFEVTDKKKNIILIGGKNGAGKTSLFTAIKVALYGPLAYGYVGANSYYTSKIKDMSKTIGVPVYEDDMRAWRFWASYLGLGNLHDMILLPNMHQYLKSALAVTKLKKGEEYTFTDFILAIKPYAEIGLSDIDGNKKINMAMSNGLRALHDEGVIQLSHKLDSGDMWFLYEAELHTIKSTVTHVTVRR